jgi:hypothetical protein
LRGSIGARKTKKYAVLEKEVPVLKVVKFFAIVTLNEFNWKKEMCGDIFLKV